jgi:hypothetical protein
MGSPLLFYSVLQIGRPSFLQLLEPVVIHSDLYVYMPRLRFTLLRTVNTVPPHTVKFIQLHLTFANSFTFGMALVITFMRT